MPKIHRLDGKFYFGEALDFSLFYDATAGALVFDTGGDEMQIWDGGDLLFYSDGGGTLELTIDGATGSITPGAVGASDLGSAALEWGDIFLASDSTILFGTGQEVDLGYISAESALVLDTGGVPFEIWDSGDLLFFSDGGTTLELTIDGATGNLVPGTGATCSLGTSTVGWGQIYMGNTADILCNTAGGSDLGSAAKEWGSIFLASDKPIFFGTGQEVDLGYISAESALVLDTGGVPTEIWDSGDLLFFSDGGTTLELTIDGATGDIIPGAAGASDLGSAALEWGNIYHATNKGTYFGNTPEVYFYYSGTAMIFDMGGQTLEIWDGQPTIGYVGGGATQAWGLRGAGGGMDLMGIGGVDAGNVEVNLHGFGHLQMFTVNLFAALELPIGTLVDPSAAASDNVTTSGIGSTKVCGVATTVHAGGTIGPICILGVVDILLDNAAVPGQYVATAGAGVGTSQAALPAAGQCVGVVIETTGGPGLARCLYQRYGN